MEPTSTSVAGVAALIKAVGTSAALGMIGAAMLYIVLPPVDAKGRFSKTEFATRLACAGVFSVLFGDMGVDVLKHFAPFLNPEKHKSAVDLMVGAPGWWISRAVALWLQRNRHRDISQVVLHTTTPNLSAPDAPPAAEIPSADVIPLKKEAP